MRFVWKFILITCEVFFFFFNNSQTQHTNTHTETQLNTIDADYIIPSLEYCQSELLVLMEITIKMCKGI